MSSMALPRLGDDGKDVIDAALHLVDEEMQIAERLERKAREQWQLVSFVAPIAIGSALTASAVKGVGLGWIIAIAAATLVTGVALVMAMIRASAMSESKKSEGLNPDVLDAYLTDLNRRQETSQAVEEVRSDLATNLITVARARATGNDERRTLLTKATWWSRAAFATAIGTLVVAAAAALIHG